MLLLAIALLSGRVLLEQHELEHLLDVGDVECELCMVAGSTPGEPPAVLAGWSLNGHHSLLSAHDGLVNRSSPCPCPPPRGPPSML